MDKDTMVAVTPEDRAAYCDYEDLDGKFRERAMSGEWDNCAGVIAFARHRIQSEGRTGVSPPTERMEKILGATFVVSGEGRTGAGEALREALDAAHYYIDASPGELADRGITRDDALRIAREKRAALSQSTAGEDGA